MEEQNLDEHLFAEKKSAPRYQWIPLIPLFAIFAIGNLFSISHWPYGEVTVAASAGCITGHSLLWAIRLRGGNGVANFLIVLSVYGVIQVATGTAGFLFLRGGLFPSMVYGIAIVVAIVCFEAVIRWQAKT